MMDGQIDIFDYLDDVQGFHYCCGCEKAKFKEHSKHGDLWFCNETRQYITSLSFDWMCKKSKGHSLFERRHT